MTAIQLTPEQRKDTAQLAYSLGHRLYMERMDRRMSLHAVYVESGVQPTIASAIERGIVVGVKLGSLVKLLRVYGLTLAIVPAAPPTPSEER